VTWGNREDRKAKPNRLLRVDLLHLAQSGELSGLANGLADGLVDLVADAELAVEPLEEVAVAVVELRVGAQDVDGARVTGLLGGEGDGRGGGLDAISLLVLGVNAHADKLRAGNVANVVLRDVLVVIQLDVSGEVELDRDSTLLDVVGVGDVDVIAVERVVDADMGVQVGEREGYLAGSGALERNADNGMVLQHAVTLVLGKEEAGDAQDEEDGEEPSDSTLEAAPLLLLPLSVGSTGATTMAESAPEASAPTSDGKLLGVVVEVVDWEHRFNWRLHVSWVLRHERCSGRHWERVSRMGEWF